MQSEQSDSVPSGRVTRTDPGANARVKRGSSVTMFVSTGPQNVSVPNVVGQTQNQASQTLQQCRLPGLRLPAELEQPVGQRSSAGPEPGGRPATAEGLGGHPHGREISAGAVTEITAWYARNGRHDLPWRRTRDRWAVLVSEVMLHQTQVARVAAAWPEFYGRFPTPAAMAHAGPGAVIQAWGTLGYPRRARRLWEAAVVIADRRLARRPRRPFPVSAATRRGRWQPSATTPTCPRSRSTAGAWPSGRGGRRSPTATPKPLMLEIGGTAAGAGSPAGADGRGRAGVPAARRRAATSARCGGGARPGACATASAGHAKAGSRDRSASGAGRVMARLRGGEAVDGSIPRRRRARLAGRRRPRRRRRRRPGSTPRRIAGERHGQDQICRTSSG